MAEKCFRRGERKETRQRVRCRNKRGTAPTVTMLDLSPSGCQVLLQGGRLITGEPVIVRPEGFVEIAGFVRWIKEDRAGIEFTAHLHPSVVDHLIKTAITESDAQRHKGFGIAESLGRRLLPMPTVTIIRSVA